MAKAKKLVADDAANEEALTTLETENTDEENYAEADKETEGEVAAEEEVEFEQSSDGELENANLISAMVEAEIYEESEGEEPVPDGAVEEEDNGAEGNGAVEEEDNGAEGNGAEGNEAADSDSDEDEAEESVEIINKSIADGDDSSYVMSNQLISLFNDAIYRRLILTGRLTGVTRTKLGLVATVTYSPSTTRRINDSATVRIAGEDMGIDERMIERAVSARASRYNLRLDDKNYEALKDTYMESVLKSMIGAKVDFIATNFQPDTKTVIGNRAMAMERRRRNYKMVKKGANYIHEGSIVLSRIIAVGEHSIAVEISGFVKTLREREITSMAISVKDTFFVGDNLRVRIREVVKDDRNNVVDVKAEGLGVNLSAARSRAAEFKRGDFVKATVISIGMRGTYYVLRMENGCRGVAYYTKGTARYRITEGSEMQCKIIGFTPEKDVVRCQFVGQLAD